MSTANKLDKKIIKMKRIKFINFLMKKKLIKKKMSCKLNQVMMKLCKYRRSIDKFAWRCINKNCKDYTKYFTGRKDSFFENFKCDIKLNLRILIKFLNLEQEHTIQTFFTKKKGLINKILKEFRR
jgi:triacylglycerol esterase/lipase EstA (alpha/beta hydrolase family)